MTVSVELLQSGQTLIVPNSGVGVNSMEVTVAMQDLPPHTHSTVKTMFGRRTDGAYTVTGHLAPFQDYFTITPSQTISITRPFEWIWVFHDDMRQYKPNGLPVRARRLSLSIPQPSPEEDAIIRPL